LQQCGSPFAATPFASAAWVFDSASALTLSLRVNTPGGWDAGGGNYIGFVDADYDAQQDAPWPAHACDWGCTAVSADGLLAEVLGISGTNAVPRHGLGLTMGTWCEFLECGLRAWGYDATLDDMASVATIPFLQTQGYAMPGGPGNVGLRHLAQWDTTIFQTSSSGYRTVVVSLADGKLSVTVDDQVLVSERDVSEYLPHRVKLLIGGSQPFSDVALQFSAC
jgi:hypothetical protein